MEDKNSGAHIVWVGGEREKVLSYASSYTTQKLAENLCSAVVNYEQLEDALRFTSTSFCGSRSAVEISCGDSVEGCDGI